MFSILLPFGLSFSDYFYAFAGLAFFFLLHRIFVHPHRYRIRTTKPPVEAARSTPRGSGAVINCIAPSTGKPLGECKSYTPADVNRVVAESRAAFDQGWSATSFTERRAVLQAIIDWIVNNQQQIVQWSVEDSGKTVSEAIMSEVLFTCEKLRWTIENGESALAREYRPVASMLMLKSAYIDYFPLGVIGIIVPWNYPFQNVVGAVAAALMAGNGCVVKVSEFASYSAAKIEQFLREILASRGHNPNLVQVITGYGETGAALVSSGVDKILFIGSPAVGKLVMKGAAANLTPVILELGGKDPFIVFDDCDFSHMIDLAIRGAFINRGQNCVSSERFYVHEKIYQKFIETMKENVGKLVVGHSEWNGGQRCDFGAMTMPAQVGIIEKLLEDAVKKGAKIVLGGKKMKNEESKGNGSGGCFFESTILADVNHSMNIANEETFGPVMTIIKFSTEAELLAMVNGTVYGLGSSIFTRDYKRADRIQQGLKCGMVNVNDFGMVPMLQCLPFGGVNASGFGSFNGVEGLRGFSRFQSVCNDRFGVRADAPAFLKYPMKSVTHKIVEQVVRIVYGKDWGEAVSAVGRLALMAVGK